MKHRCHFGKETHRCQKLPVGGRTKSARPALVGCLSCSSQGQFLPEPAPLPPVEGLGHSPVRALFLQAPAAKGDQSLETPPVCIEHFALFTRTSPQVSDGSGCAKVMNQCHISPVILCRDDFQCFLHSAYSAYGIFHAVSCYIFAIQAGLVLCFLITSYLTRTTSHFWSLET